MIWRSRSWILNYFLFCWKSFTELKQRFGDMMVETERNVSLTELTRSFDENSFLESHWTQRVIQRYQPGKSSTWPSGFGTSLESRAGKSNNHALVNSTQSRQLWWRRFWRDTVSYFQFVWRLNKYDWDWKDDFHRWSSISKRIILFMMFHLSRKSKIKLSVEVNRKRLSLHSSHYSIIVSWYISCSKFFK